MQKIVVKLLALVKQTKIKGEKMGLTMGDVILYSTSEEKSKLKPNIGYILTCSKCGESYYTGYDCTPDAKEKLENGDCYNYCPHCGAKMDESVKQ